MSRPTLTHTRKHILEIVAKQITDRKEKGQYVRKSYIGGLINALIGKAVYERTGYDAEMCNFDAEMRQGLMLPEDMFEGIVAYLEEIMEASKQPVSPKDFVDAEEITIPKVPGPEAT